MFAQNIDCEYLLEPPHQPPRRGGSNEYPQSMLWSKNKKNRYTPAYSSFAIKGMYITVHGHVFLILSAKAYSHKMISLLIITFNPDPTNVNCNI